MKMKTPTKKMFMGGMVKQVVSAVKGATPSTGSSMFKAPTNPPPQYAGPATGPAMFNPSDNPSPQFINANNGGTSMVYPSVKSVSGEKESSEDTKMAKGGMVKKMSKDKMLKDKGAKIPAIAIMIGVTSKPKAKAAPPKRKK